MESKYDHEFCKNLDMNLGREIAAALKVFAQETEGAPESFVLNSIGVGDAQKRWHEALEAMIWSFQEIANGKPGRPDPDTLSDADFKRQLQSYNKRVQHGLALFAEHYTNLWL